jgi:uncharacterized damage-inducible protein DinB
MTETTIESGTLDRERADLIETLARHRWFLTFTVQGLTDEQATARTTASALTLAGLIHHVAETEAQWAAFMEQGAGAFAAAAALWNDREADLDPQARWRLAEGETLAEALAHYAEVAAATERIIRSVPSLDADHELPRAPWFEPDARWSVRRTLLHILAETAQHAGHADILRESLDGQRTMG